MIVREHYIPDMMLDPQGFYANKIEKMNQMPLADIIGGLIIDRDRTGIATMISVPEGRASIEEALEANPVVVGNLLSFANGCNAVNGVYNQFYANASGQVVVALASPSWSSTVHNFGFRDLADISSGRVDGLMSKYADAFNRSRVMQSGLAESVVASGFSQGGSLVFPWAKLLRKHNDLDGVASGDPTTSVARNRRQLLDALTSTDYKDLRQVIEKCGFLPALEALRYEGPEKEGDIGRTIRYGVDIFGAPLLNWAITGALGQRRLYKDIVDSLDSGVSTLVARAHDSAIFDKQHGEHLINWAHDQEVLLRDERQPKETRLTLVTFEGNHAIANDPRVNSEMIRLAQAA